MSRGTHGVALSVARGVRTQAHLSLTNVHRGGHCPVPSESLAWVPASRGRECAAIGP